MTGWFSVSVNQLAYLVAVAETGGLAQAASKLGVSPSALSQGLSELERRLRLPLFERSGRNRVLTSHGLQAVDHAERILAVVADMNHWAMGVRSGDEDVLRIGLIDVAVVEYFGKTLQTYKSNHPKVDLQLTVAPSSRLLADVLAARLDAAIIVESATMPAELSVQTLLSEELALYCPAGTAANRTPAQWGPWVSFPASSHTRQLVMAKLGSLGASLDVVAISHQPEVLRQMVALGMGWAVLPSIQAEAEPNRLKRARVEPVAVRNIVLIQRMSAPARSSVQRLVEVITASTRT